MIDDPPPAAAGLAATEYAATAAQRRILHQNAVRPDDGATNLAFAFTLTGPVDLGRLSEALQALVLRGPGLRTSFALRDGRWLSRVHPSPGPVGTTRLPRTDDLACEQDLVARRVGQRADRPTPPDDPDQVRIDLYRGVHALHLGIVCSHAVGDAYTFYAFARVLEQLYVDPGLVASSLLAAHPGTVGRTERDGSPRGRGEDPTGIAQDLAGVEHLAHPALRRDRPGAPLRGEVLQRPLPADLAARLRSSALVAAHGRAAVLLVAHALVLGATVGQDDVVVGVPLANRGREARTALGYFVNTLPLHVPLGGTEDLDALCGLVRARLRRLVRHQHVDLPDTGAAVARDSTGSGLDNAFTLYRQELSVRLPGCGVQRLAVPRSVVPYPLTTTVADTGDGYLLEVSASTEVVASAPLDRFELALESLVTTPGRRPAAVPLVPGADGGGGAPTAPPRRAFPVRRTLDEAFAATAAASPAAPALVGEDGTTVSYAALSARVDQWAAALLRLTTGRYVLVSLPRGEHQVVAALAVLRAGRAYVPVDPAAPPQRVAHVVEALRAAEGVAPPAIAREAPEGAGTVLRPEDLDAGDEADLPDRPSLPGRPSVTPQDAAYVIFTSGSTGVPKGVRVSHGSVARLLAAGREHVDAGAQDTWVLFHSLAFDFSVWELFGCLLSGGRLLVPQDRTVRDPSSFAQVLSERGVTVLNQTPSALRRLSASLGEVPAPTSVRWLVLGGEPVHPAELRTWFEHVGAGSRVLNMYGITETTVHVTAHEIAPAHTTGPDAGRTSPIGRPLSDLGVAVVDRHLRQVPVGVVGELLVWGPGLALDYLGRPDLTADRFLEGTPYADRVYRTGDMAYVDADGCLFYRGRRDRQVQLRGYRVELGEVEAALLRLPGVRGAVAALVHDGEREPHLVAWLAGRPPAAPQRRRLLEAVLPPWMVPSAVEVLEELPVTSNGKVDVAALPHPGRRAPAAAGAGAPAAGSGSDEVAVAVASVFASVIGNPDVGVDDGFLEAGGTSMHLVETHRRLREDLLLEGLSLVDLLESGSARSLAARWSGAGRGDGVTSELAPRLPAALEPRTTPRVRVLRPSTAARRAGPT